MLYDSNDLMNPSSTFYTTSSSSSYNNNKEKGEWHQQQQRRRIRKKRGTTTTRSRICTTMITTAFTNVYTQCYVCIVWIIRCILQQIIHHRFLLSSFFILRKNLLHLFSVVSSCCSCDLFLCKRKKQKTKSIHTTKHNRRQQQQTTLFSEKDDDDDTSRSIFSTTTTTTFLLLRVVTRLLVVLVVVLFLILSFGMIPKMKRYVRDYQIRKLHMIQQRSNNQYYYKKYVPDLLHLSFLFTYKDYYYKKKNKNNKKVHHDTNSYYYLHNVFVEEYHQPYLLFPPSPTTTTTFSYKAYNYYYMEPTLSIGTTSTSATTTAPYIFEQQSTIPVQVQEEHNILLSHDINDDLNHDIDVPFWNYEHQFIHSFHTTYNKDQRMMVVPTTRYGLLMKEQTNQYCQKQVTNKCSEHVTFITQNVSRSSWSSSSTTQQRLVLLPPVPNMDHVLIERIIQVTTRNNNNDDDNSNHGSNVKYVYINMNTDIVDDPFLTWKVGNNSSHHHHWEEESMISLDHDENHHHQSIHKIEKEEDTDTDDDISFFYDYDITKKVYDDSGLRSPELLRIPTIKNENQPNHRVLKQYETIPKYCKTLWIVPISLPIPLLVFHDENNNNDRSTHHQHQIMILRNKVKRYIRAFASSRIFALDTIQPVVVFYHVGYNEKLTTTRNDPLKSPSQQQQQGKIKRIIAFYTKWIRHHGGYVLHLNLNPPLTPLRVPIDNTKQQNQNDTNDSFHNQNNHQFTILNVPTIIEKYKLFQLPMVCTKYIIYTEPDIMFVNNITYNDLRYLKFQLLQPLYQHHKKPKTTTTTTTSSVDQPTNNNNNNHDIDMHKNVSNQSESLPTLDLWTINIENWKPYILFSQPNSNNNRMNKHDRIYDGTKTSTASSSSTGEGSIDTSVVVLDIPQFTTDLSYYWSLCHHHGNCTDHNDPLPHQTNNNHNDLYDAFLTYYNERLNARYNFVKNHLSHSNQGNSIVHKHLPLAWNVKYFWSIENESSITFDLVKVVHIPSIDGTNTDVLKTATSFHNTSSSIDFLEYESIRSSMKATNMHSNEDDDTDTTTKSGWTSLTSSICCDSSKSANRLWELYQKFQLPKEFLL